MVMVDKLKIKIQGDYKMKKNISYEEFVKQANYKLRKMEKAEEQKSFSAERLRKVMENNGATEKDIETEAYKLNIYPPACDTMEGYIKLIMSGQVAPSVRMLKAICVSVNVSADYLMGLSERVY